jgi:hypothetical protein|tara:strand:+ start:1008 stop:1307 length:300 start_codon:yes stop_codon:yes gene_type:complete
MSAYSNDYKYVGPEDHCLGNVEGCFAFRGNLDDLYKIYIGRHMEEGVVLAIVSGREKEVVREIMSDVERKSPIVLSKDPLCEIGQAIAKMVLKEIMDES